jgi:Mn-dependent DtxR family transcriptional regulator
MLGVDPEVAADDACKIEHDISAESFGKIKEHILEEHPDFRL